MHVSQDLAAQQLVEPACFGQFTHSNLRWRMKAKTSRNKFQTLSQKWNAKVSLWKMIFYQFPLIFITCAKQSIKDSKFLYSMMMRINIPCPHVCAHIIYMYGLVNNSESELRFWVCSTWVVLMFRFKSPTFNHNLKIWTYGVTAQLQKIMLRKSIFISYTVVGPQQRTIYRKRLRGKTTSITIFLRHWKPSFQLS